MKDVRLLSLYKQHYLDDYASGLPADISCLGYYDGLNITKVVQNQNSRITKKKSKAPISELWYNTGKEIESLKGGYSNQNIGLFRGIYDEKRKKDTELYWKEEKELPFISVSFLKLKNCKESEKVCKEIEEYNDEQEKKEFQKVCRVLTYYTFDNADIVLLIKGNCIAKIEDICHGVEAKNEVAYLHSILGIEEDYLKQCKEKGKILRDWEATCCFIDEKVKQINLLMATSGNSKILSLVKGCFDKWDKQYKLRYSGINCFYITGHGNICMNISDTDVRSLLVLLLPEGLVTHQNGIYGCGLYNIESSIFIKGQDWESVTAAESAGKLLQSNKFWWCKTIIEKYGKYFAPNLIKGNEGLYSYCQSLIQTLNALDQYERFSVSKGIFYLIFPSFVMFEHQFDRFINYNNDENIKSDFKNPICEYLESVNSVIYHTVHTDQIYLMIPGYSGTSYSIPVKLNLFYAWFVHKVTNILNDNQREYSWIITPVMESRPKTKGINIAPNDVEKLICIHLSQRSLFFPRNLMIILCHEIGHYIGNSMRCRNLRLRHIVQSLSYFISEGLFPDAYEDYYVLPQSENENNIYHKMKTIIRYKLQVGIQNIMNDKIPNICIDKEYHSTDILKPLERLCNEVVSEVGAGADICKIIYEIPPEVKALVRSNEQEYVQDMRYIARIQNRINNNRRILTESTVLQKIIREIIKIYRELFADVVSISILECMQEDYQEAFWVSEGVKDSKNELSELIIRKDTVEKILYPKQKSSQQTGRSIKHRKIRTIEDYLIENMTNFIWLRKNFESYAEECYMKLKERVEQCKSDIVEVREMFQIFCDGKTRIEQIYAKMSECIVKYQIEIEKMYQKKIKDIDNKNNNVIQ